MVEYHKIDISLRTVTIVHEGGSDENPIVFTVVYYSVFWPFCKYSFCTIFDGDFRRIGYRLENIFAFLSYLPIFLWENIKKSVACFVHFHDR